MEIIIPIDNHNNKKTEKKKKLEDDYEPHKGRTAVKFDKNSKFEKDLSLAHKALDGISREISHFTVQPFDSIDITKKGTHCHSKNQQAQNPNKKIKQTNDQIKK